MKTSSTSHLAKRAASILALALAARLCVWPAAAQELPPAIEADRLLLVAEQQIQDEHFHEALATLDLIVELQAQHDLTVPESFWFRHAFVALMSGAHEKARLSAVRYLELTGQEGEHYMAALELVIDAERLASAASEGETLGNELQRQAEENTSGRVFRDCARCPVMIEVPTRQLAVGVYEVTFAEWDACADGGGCGGYRPDDGGWSRGKRAVVNVSRDDALLYTAWLSELTGKQYRLPTETEWNYLYARDVQHDTRDCQPVDPSEGTPCTDRDLYAEPSPVGQGPLSPDGLYGVNPHGRIAEWTIASVVRGGGVRGSSGGRFTKPFTTRYVADPASRSNRLGFRVVRVMN